ncbi:MAG: MliC family protein [Pseudomonadota bacterium]
MRLFLLIPACALAACTPQPANDAAPDNAATIIDAKVPEPSPTLAPLNPPAPGEPGGLDNDTTPVSEAPFTADSAQGAANVVQTYYALIEQGKVDQAYALWEPGAAGMRAPAFAASFAKYSEVHANIGAPGDIDAGAGQRYVTVPVQVYGRLKDGTPFNMRGSVTLHRTEVDGATPEQRKWHIRSSDIAPSTERPRPRVADNRSTARYRCMDGSKITANFDPDNARVTIVRAGRTLATLPQQRVASGIAYAGRGYELRGKGDAMTFTAPGQPPLACTAIR